MKQFFLLLANSILFISCNTLNQMNKEDSHFTGNSLSFETASNMIIFQNKVDDNKSNSPFMFDTGFTFTNITDTLIVNNLHKRKFTSFGVTRVANNEKLQTKNINIDLTNQLLASKNAFVKVYQKENMECTSKIYEGIFGMSTFQDMNAILSIDFDKKTIKTIKEHEIIGYDLVNSKMKGPNFYIEMDVNNTKNFYLLDTGNNGNIFIEPSKQKIELPSTERVGINSITAKGLDNVSITKIYNNVPVKVSGHEVFSGINESSTITQFNAGMNLIQNFNWILDWKNKKVYIKKRVFEEVVSKRNPYYVYSQNNKLLIINKEKSEEKYSIGNEVISVNGKKVSAENICEMQKLLNNAQDWDKLNITIKK